MLHVAAIIIITCLKPAKRAASPGGQVLLPLLLLLPLLPAQRLGRGDHPSVACAVACPLRDLRRQSALPHAAFLLEGPQKIASRRLGRCRGAGPLSSPASSLTASMYKTCPCSCHLLLFGESKVQAAVLS